MVFRRKVFSQYKEQVTCNREGNIITSLKIRT